MGGKVHITRPLTEGDNPGTRVTLHLQRTEYEPAPRG
jgi:hypothetical protein